MNPRELATRIARHDVKWCKDNAEDRRPRDWAADLAAVLWEQIIQPIATDASALADQVAVLESHCSCWKPDVVSITAPARAELWGRIAEALSILGHRPMDQATKDELIRVLRGESVAVPDKGVS